MSYELEDKKKEDEEVQQLSSGQSGVITGQTPTAPKSAPNRSGSWTNLNTYLDSNKDNAADMSKNITSTVSSNINSAVDSLDSTKEGSTANVFNQAVKDNTVEFKDGLVNSALNNADEFVQNQANVDAFNQLKNATYAGPQDFSTSENFQQTQKTFDKVQQDANALQSEAGRYGFLNDWAKNTGVKGQYSRGMGSLDNLMFQNNPDSKAQTSSLAEQVKPLPELFNSKVAELDNAALQAKQTTDATRERTNSSLGSAISGLKSNIEQRTAQMYQAEKADADRVEAKIKAGQELSEQEARKYTGRSAAEYNSLLGQAKASGIDMGSGVVRISDPTSSFNAQRVASAQDYAKWQALQKLMGTNDTWLSDKSLAGTGGRLQEGLTKQAGRSDLMGFNIQRILNMLEGI